MIEDVPLSASLASTILHVHDVGVSASPTRRRFTAAYKLKILDAVAGCTQPGDISALLRRGGLYSSHLTAWRSAQRLRADKVHDGVNVGVRQPEIPGMQAI